MRKRDHKPRKSLRERVADRKAGVREKSSPGRERIMRWVQLLSNLFQGIGLVMILVELARYINSSYGELNWINIMIYSGMFLTGRAVIAFMNLSRMIR